MNDRTASGRAAAVPVTRIARLARLGALTAGVAGSMAMGGMTQLGQGRHPSMRNLLLTPGNIQRLTDQLSRMRGAAMKVGQMMSMDGGDILPPELARIMTQLRSDAHFMPPAQLKQVLDRNWPARWLRSFERFDVRPVAAASIGQVHRARLRDGRYLAIKVQYPGVAQSIDSDLANVGALIRMSGLLPAGFDIAPYLEEARRQLYEETDYLREGRCLSQFNALLNDDARFTLPSVHEDWTTPHILAMSFVEGQPIEDVANAPQDVRDELAVSLIDLVLRELCEFRLVQSDPNFANYRYDPGTGRIILLDFGATRQIDPAIADLYRHLILAGLTRDLDAQRRVAAEIGFFGAETEPSHRDRILRMIEMAFAELRETREFDFARTDLPRRMQAEGMALADDGFLPPPLPIDALYLQRKFGGMFLLASRLGARVPVADLVLDRLSQDPGASA